jgi:hypothetical protein
MVKELGKEDDIDRSYYDALVNDAVESLVAYGDFTWFVSDDEYIGPKFKNGKPMYGDTIPYPQAPYHVGDYVHKLEQR